MRYLIVSFSDLCRLSYFTYFKTNYHLMQVKSIAEFLQGKHSAILQGEHSAILSNFIKLPFVNKIFVLSIFDWPFYTGFTVYRHENNITLYYVKPYYFMTIIV